MPQAQAQVHVKGGFNAVVYIPKGSSWVASAETQPIFDGWYPQVGSTTDGDTLIQLNLWGSQKIAAIPAQRINGNLSA